MYLGKSFEPESAIHTRRPRGTFWNNCNDWGPILLPIWDMSNTKSDPQYDTQSQISHRVAYRSRRRSWHSNSCSWWSDTNFFAVKTVQTTRAKRKAYNDEITFERRDISVCTSGSAAWELEAIPSTSKYFTIGLV
jgi:hypothetical protein